MKVTLNLDTPEKKAFFLLLTDSPTALVDVVTERMLEPGVHDVKEKLKDISVNGFYKLQGNIFTQKDWEEVYDTLKE